MASGLYLAWYWLNDIRENYDDDLTGRVLTWQERIADTIDRNRTVIAVVLTIMVLIAIAFARGVGRRTSDVE